MDLHQSTKKNVSFQISLRWPICIINPVDKTELSHVYVCCFSCISNQKIYHKTKDLTDSETPSRDESAVLASPTSSTCSPAPTICITPEMIAINTFIEHKGQDNRTKRTAMRAKLFRTWPAGANLLCSWARQFLTQFLSPLRYINGYQRI